jgi:hypothetical protein
VDGGPNIFAAGPITHVEGRVGVVYADFGVAIDWLGIFCRTLVVGSLSDARIASYGALSEPDTVVRSVVTFLWVRARVVPGDLSFLASCLKTCEVASPLSPRCPIFGFLC